MKLKYIITLCCVALFATSCYEDNSATDFKIVSPITIDFGDKSQSINVFQFDILEIIPIVYKNGLPDHNMSYSWRIQGNNYPITEIATTMSLKYEIELPPNSTAYKFILKVTDNVTKIEKEETVSVTVTSRYGEGLFVADTRDETTSDISLIMSMNFTRYLKEESNTVYRDIYSIINKEKVQGIVTDMQSLVKSDSRTLTLFTENHLYRMDPYDLKLNEKDNDVFFVPIEGAFKPTLMCKKNYSGYEYFVIGGKIHQRNSYRVNMYFTFYMFHTDKSDYRLSQAITVNKGYYTSSPLCYDELHNRFLMVNSIGDGLAGYSQQNADLPFDVNNVGALDAIAMTEGDKYSLVTILKSEVGNNYYIYTMNTTVADNGGNIPILKLDISKCPNIDKATGFTASPVSEDFFYSAENKIYTFPINKPNPVAVERYTADPGEKITSLMLWKNEYAKMKISDESIATGVRTVDAENKLLVITTYNETTKEGKVITIPIIRSGDGALEEMRELHTVHGGFGRITKVIYNQVGY